MKKIEIDDELYQYIASNTQSIGESASDILRRLLKLTVSDKTIDIKAEPVKPVVEQVKQEVAPESPQKSQSNRCDTVFNRLNKEDLAMQKGAVGRFLFLLSMLHRSHKGIFERVIEIKGRDRVYFAHSKEELEDSGSSTNPKQIPDSDYWVITNSNTTRKKMMLHEVATCLGYSDSDAERIRDFL
jgi:negative modulator of initiation of replication